MKKEAKLGEKGGLHYFKNKNIFLLL